MNELSVIIPYLSSSETLASFIDKLSVYLMENPGDVDVIIVANEGAGLSESTVKQFREKYSWLKLKVLQRKGKFRSYGALVRFGIAYSTSRYAVLVSPYGEDDISLINEMLRKIRKGAQVVQVTRYSSEADTKIIPLKYRMYQFIYRFLIKGFLGFKISDSTYGYKMFDRIFIQALGLTQNGYSICPEITLKALLAGGKVEYLSPSIAPQPVNKNFVGRPSCFFPVILGTQIPNGNPD